MRAPKNPKLPRVTVTTKSGMSFMVGDAINPKWGDLHYAVMKLYYAGYFINIMGRLSLPEEFLAGANQPQTEAVVPLLLRELDHDVSHGVLDYTTDLVLATGCWIIAWYWHLKLGGPRPEVDHYHATSYAKYGAIPEFKCPFCDRTFDPRGVKYQVIMREYVVWLTTHARDYHKWDIGKIVARAPKSK